MLFCHQHSPSFQVSSHVLIDTGRSTIIKELDWKAVGVGDWVQPRSGLNHIAFSAIRSATHGCVKSYVHARVIVIQFHDVQATVYQ
jgi:hypothetical protein